MAEENEKKVKQGGDGKILASGRNIRDIVEEEEEDRGKFNPGEACKREAYTLAIELSLRFPNINIL